MTQGFVRPLLRTSKFTLLPYESFPVHPFYRLYWEMLSVDHAVPNRVFQDPLHVDFTNCLAKQQKPGFVVPVLTMGLGLAGRSEEGWLWREREMKMYSVL